jgi:tripartite-type tricarboxylate transporter receptor subunit TctC
MTIFNRPATLAAALVFAITASAAAQAQNYPNRAIRLIAAFPAGGPSDIVARAVARKMSEALGQPFVVDNRAGAGGHIGAEAVAKSPPDGYNVLLGASFLVIGPSQYKKLPYDPLNDLAPIGLIAINQYLLVTHPSVPAKSVRDLLRVAKAAPGKLNYASAGLGAPPHLSAELFKTMGGVDMLHVPYKGATPALVDLVGGHVDVYFGGISGALPLARAGKIRALGVTGARRSSQLPDIPTIAESGLPGFEVTTWFGLLVPAGTSREIIGRLSKALMSVIAEPEMKKYLIEQGVDPVTNTPDEFAAYMKREVPKFARIVQAAGIKPE